MQAVMLSEAGGQKRGLAEDVNVGVIGVHVAYGTEPSHSHPGEDPDHKWCTEACSTQAVDLWEMKGGNMVGH